MLLRNVLICVGFCFLVADAKAGGFAHFNYYPYLGQVDDDSAFTVNTANTFNARLSYFGFLNLFETLPTETRGRKVQYFSEQNLRYKMAEDSAWDWTLQANFRSGDSNDRYRLGVRWRVSDSDMFKAFFDTIHMRYALNLHAIQFDRIEGRIWQWEHSFGLRFPYISDRLYLAGFIDHNFNEPLPPTITNDPVVSEVQLGYRVIDNFYVTAEYRIIEYRRRDINNFALGVEYKLNW